MEDGYSWWPEGSQPVAGRVAVVVASYNTCELTALLIWSLRRNLDWPDLQILVVDNGSTDGSRGLLSETAEAGVCSVLLNETNLQHGPALNLGMSALAQQPELPEWVWILDSDCVVARADVLTAALGRVERAAILGEPKWDPWMGIEHLEAYSLLVDPARVWRPEVGPFADGGDPVWAVLEGARQAGLTQKSFAFAEDGYVIHRGRSTLATLLANDERSNPHFEWAIDHHQPHFGGMPGAAERWRHLIDQHRAEVPTLTGRALARACR